MNWEQKAVIACEEKGLTVLGFEGGWVFVRDDAGKVHAVGEHVVAEWIAVKENVK